jgi:hypothetical protein
MLGVYHNTLVIHRIGQQSLMLCPRGDATLAHEILADLSQECFVGLATQPPSYFATAVRLLSIFSGRNVSFCTRQLVISPTYTSFSLRQSISCTVPNYFSCLPPAPNLPRIAPSSSIL